MKIQPYESDAVIGRTVRSSVDSWSDSMQDDSCRGRIREYRAHALRKVAFILICIVVSFVVAGYAVTIGDTHIGFLQTYEIIWDHCFGTVKDLKYDLIVMDLRLPRVLIGLVAGAGLAVAGAVMQSVLKNPLADPYTTGVSSGALFGVSLGMWLGLSITVDTTEVFLMSFIFSLIPTAVIIFVARMKKASPTTMIMAGIAVMYIFNALTTIIKLRTDAESLSSLYKWQVGSLSFADSSCIPLMFVVVLAGTLFMQFVSRKLNVLNSGDDNAKALGVDADTLRVICLLVVAVMSAVVVSFVGLIGFIGLVAPHVVRIFIGPDNKFLLIGSAFFGAMVLVVADLIGRTIIAPEVIQVGVITAFFGGPLFLWLIIRKKSRIW